MKLTFGKYKGHLIKDLRWIDCGYVEWLAENAYSADVRGVAQAVMAANPRVRYSADEREFLKEQEVLRKQEAEEEREFVEKHQTLRWTIPDGREIKVVVDPFAVHCYTYYVNGVYAGQGRGIEVCSVPGRPEIVGRIGKLGLTEEQCQKLIAIKKGENV